MPKLVPYFILTEKNDWEGETWRFYVPLDGNETQIAIVEKYLADLKANHGAEDFPYSTEHAKLHMPSILRGNSSGQYMAEHQLIERLDLGKMKATDWAKLSDSESEVNERGERLLRDYLYKGGLREFAGPT